MINELIETFREQAGLIPSLETQSTEINDCVFINFNSAKNPNKLGGYARFKLHSGFLIIQCVNVHGDIFQETVVHCSSFNTIGE